MTPTNSIALSRASGQRWGVSALALAIATPIVAVIGWIWAAVTPGSAALGVAIAAVAVVALLALGSIVVGVVSLIVSKPNSMAKVSLVLVGATAIVLVLLVIPPSALPV
jgi:hypothetical protein